MSGTVSGACREKETVPDTASRGRRCWGRLGSLRQVSSYLMPERILAPYGFVRRINHGTIGAHFRFR